MGSDNGFQRLAVYFTLPKGPLAAFGASWMGWDIATGMPADHPIMSGIPIPISFMTAKARKYGFHATMKAPFCLANGASIEIVQQALETLCKDNFNVQIGAVEVTALGRFLALVPKDPPEALNALAARVVEQLDPFRAALTEEEFARKDTASLSDRQRGNLRTYGAPHVMEDYKFHITLTDRLSRPHLAAVQDVLKSRFAEVLPQSLILDALSLVGQTQDGHFQVIGRYKLGS